MKSLLGLGAVAILAASLLVAHVQEKADSLHSLMVARNEAAQKVWTYATMMRGTSEDMFGDQVGESRLRWSLRIAEAAVDAGAKPIQDAYAQHLARMTEFAEATKNQSERGRSSSLQVAVAEFYVADARVLAEKAKKN
jgi:hypothetical protein